MTLRYRTLWSTSDILIRNYFKSPYYSNCFLFMISYDLRAIYKLVYVTETLKTHSLWAVGILAKHHVKWVTFSTLSFHDNFWPYASPIVSKWQFCPGKFPLRIIGGSVPQNHPQKSWVVLAWIARAPPENKRWFCTGKLFTPENK